MNDEQRQKLARFLRCAIDANESLDSIMSTCGVSNDDLFEWSRQPLFKRWLERMTRGSAARREIEVSRAALHAAERMSSLISERRTAFDRAMSDVLRRLYVDAIKLARSREDKQSAARRVAEARQQLGAAPMVAGELDDAMARELMQKLGDQQS